MAISKIQQTQRLGIFRDFRWPTDLPHFARYNLIYGWNGSGKTTISRLFRNLETKNQPDQGSAIVSIDGSDVRSNDFPNSNIVIKVFNNEFVNANVHRSDGGNIPPIFVLGETSARQQRELQEKQHRLQVIENELTEREQGLRNAQRELDRHTQITARYIKDNLRSNTYSQYNDYDKRNYIARVASMIQSDDARESILDDDQITAAREQFSSGHLEAIDSMQLPMMDLTAHNNNISRLLQQSVISNVIDSLQNDAELASWIRMGLNLHEERNIDICLFCDQSLPAERLNDLNSHFNEAFEHLMEEIDGEIEGLTNVVGDLNGIELPDASRLYTNLRHDYDQANVEFALAVSRSVNLIEGAIAELHSKIQNMFAPLDRQSDVIRFDRQALSGVNEVIERHNEISGRHMQEVGRAAELLEGHWVARNLSTYVAADQSVNCATEQRDALTNEQLDLNAAIPLLQSELIDHRRPANEFNRELSSYLGHDELQLRAEETGYTIVRSGHPAFQISEGEQTAIALIYFLKSLDNVDHGIIETIVVLDDPISSLDSNALFAAYGLIRERCRNAKQLFLLTHNFVFFREFRDWFKTDNRYTSAGCDRPAEFFMLKQEFDEYGRKSVICELDPLLKNFESDYHYLFWYVFKTAEDVNETDLQKFYPLPNITRRLLEMFLAFKFPHLNQGIGASLAEAEIQPHVRRRIMRYVDTFSHGNAINEPGHDPSLLAQTPSVLGSVLEVMREIDDDHVSRMISAVT